MKIDHLRQAASVTEEKFGAPDVNDYVQTFVEMFPEEVRLHGDAASRRALNAEFRAYFHRVAETFEDDDQANPRQYEFDLPGDPVEAYLLVEDKARRSFKPVRFERAFDSDFEGSIRYSEALAGRITHKVEDRRKKLAYLRGFPGFADNQRNVGEVLRKPESKAS